MAVLPTERRKRRQTKTRVRTGPYRPSPSPSSSPAAAGGLFLSPLSPACAHGYTEPPAPPGGATMRDILDWLKQNHETIVRNLADLVAVPSISTDGEHTQEVERTAALTCQQMREAGLQNVEILRVGDSLPYAYGEWLNGPDRPTVFLYAHHDVQPINFEK